MKKLMCFLCSVMVSVPVLAASYSSVVGPTPSLVIPAPTVQLTSAETWVVGVTTNAPGTVMAMYTNLYVCPVGGVSTGVVPPLVAGDLTDGASVIWRPILDTPRKGLAISNNGTNTLYVSATSNALGGFSVAIGETRMFTDCSNLQMGLWLRTTTPSSTTANIMEW